MGNRVSISFWDGQVESVAFFSHWDGKRLCAAAREYIKSLGPYSKDNKIEPLDRREAGTVMVNFVSWYLGGKPSPSNYYFGSMDNPMCGDNSDNGHFKIDSKTGNVVK